MQFSIIGDWLIEGQSPHTHQPVVETCRLVKLPKIAEFCDGDWLYNGTVWTASKATEKTRRLVTPCRAGGVATVAVRKFAIGDTYAIQPGRGKPAIGRTPPLVSIARQDVRDMTPEDAVRRGFRSVLEYLQAWTQMHDPGAAFYFSYLDSPVEGSHWHYWKNRQQKWVEASDANEVLAFLRGRPDARYQAWVLSFA